MKSYWVDFVGADSTCLVAEDKEEAEEIASDERDQEIRSIDILPHPARPCLNKDDWLFCYKRNLVRAKRHVRGVRRVRVEHIFFTFYGGCDERR